MSDLKYIKHQIFKYEIPYKMLIDLLIDVCDSTPTSYIFNKTSYKRSKLNSSLIQSHLDRIAPYYHTSKSHYIDNGKSNRGLATIIRQLCKYYNIKIDINNEYIFSKTLIRYTIHIQS